MLTFPDYISTVKLSPDQMQVAVGAGTYNADIIANVYIVECV